MSLLTPPKTPLRLAVYCIVLFFIISLIWSYVLGLSNEDTSFMTIFFFGIVGYFYGKSHGTTLSFGKAFLTCLYFIIPPFLFKFLARMDQFNIASMQQDERIAFFAIAGGGVILLLFLFLSAAAFMLSYMTKVGVKKVKPPVQERNKIG